jgi:ABC-type multidrug transport system fused ATPase/permease subunit
MLTSQVWFHLRVKIMGSVGTVLIAVLSVILRLDPAMAALAFNYSIDLPAMVLWSVRQLAQAESSMVAYERIFDLMYQYGEEVDKGSETRRTVQPTGLEWRNACMSIDGYSILKDVSIRIGPGERVCIVGRTGSGKSSLLLSLLRLYECTDGQILLNEVDICAISLRTLRSSIGYVSQEPICFEDQSVRYNLDPAGQLLDSQLWSVLKAVGITIKLDDVVESCTDIVVREKLNLARGLVRRCPVLLLDEPLASLPAKDLDALLKSGSLDGYLVDTTIVAVTHRQEWQQFCARSFIMSNGRIIM